MKEAGRGVMLLAGLALFGAGRAECGSSFNDEVKLTFKLARTGAKTWANKDGMVVKDKSDKGTRRILVDKERNVYFGYLVEAEKTGVKDTIRVTIKPLPEGPGEVFSRGWNTMFPGRSLPTALALSDAKYPPPQEVKNGDVVLFEALVNPQTGEKLYDVIEVSLTTDEDREMAKRTVLVAGAEGVTVGGRVPALAMIDAQLVVNGEQMQNRASCTGQVIYFFREGEGRILISLAKSKGFEKAAQAQLVKDKIDISLDGVRYEWLSTEPIVRIPGSAERKARIVTSGSLWVKREPQWRGPIDGSPEPKTYGCGAESAGRP